MPRRMIFFERKDAHSIANQGRATFLFTKNKAPAGALSLPGKPRRASFADLVGFPKKVVIGIENRRPWREETSVLPALLEFNAKRLKPTVVESLIPDCHSWPTRGWINLWALWMFKPVSPSIDACVVWSSPDGRSATGCSFYNAFCRAIIFIER